MSYGKPPKEHQFTSENQPENNGRPKGSLNVKTRIIRILEVMNEKEGKDNLDAMIAKVIEKARTKGDVNAFNSILDRIEGKPVQKQEHANSDGEPFILKWRD